VDFPEPGFPAIIEIIGISGSFELECIVCVEKEEPFTGKLKLTVRKLSLVQLEAVLKLPEVAWGCPGWALKANR